MSEINSVKLDRLKTHLNKGGSTEIEEVKKFLKIQSEPLALEYLAALKVTPAAPEQTPVDDGLGEDTPEYASSISTEEILNMRAEGNPIGVDSPIEPTPEFEELQPPAPQPVIQEPALPKPSIKERTTTFPTGKRYFLKDADGNSVELEVSSEGPKVVTLTMPTSKDEVEILVRGQVRKIDLAALRQLPPNEVVPEFGQTVATLIALGELSKG